MVPTDYFKIILETIRYLTPAITSGIFTVILLSCSLFGIQTYWNFSQGIFSVGKGVFENGFIHTLFIYPFYHRTLVQFLLDATALVFLGGSLEKGVGTVRFLVLFSLISITTGLLYAFLDLLEDRLTQRHVEGLLPASLACVAFTTTHTKMIKGFLCGVSFPTMALPWLFVVVTTALIPHSVLPCNIIAVVTGCMYGRGWFSILDVSEARAGILEKMLPFRMLRNINKDMFVPASAEERRKTLLPQINPAPGSYPVQAYAPVTNMNAGGASKMYEGWQDSTSSVFCPADHVRPQEYGLPNSFGTHDGRNSEQCIGQSCNDSNPRHVHL